MAIQLIAYRSLLSQSAASLTLGSLGAYLRSKEFDVRFSLWTKNDLRNAIEIQRTREPLIIIAKPNFKDHEEMLPLLYALKNGNIANRIFLCGPFAALNAKSILEKNLWIDGIIMNAVEETAATLLASMNTSCDTWDLECAGGIWRDPTTQLCTVYKVRVPQLSMDDLPFSTRDIERCEKGAFVNIEASRGCIFQCSFCHVPPTTEKTSHSALIYKRSSKLVVQEMKIIQQKLGKSLFIFNDSCFWASQSDDTRISELCDVLDQEALDIRMYVYLRCSPFVGEDLLKRLVNVGLTRVFLGIENVAEESQKVFQKRIIEHSYETLKKLLDPMRVNIHIGYITFEPYSSLQNIRSNIDYLYNIGKLFRLGVVLEPVRIVPMTSLYHQLIREGRMAGNLPYNRITYGYSFLHPEVGELLAAWKKVFGGNLATMVYAFEYYATTLPLLSVLAWRINHNFDEILSDQLSLWNSTLGKATTLLHEFFIASLDAVENGATKESLSASRDVDAFTSSFCELVAVLQLQYIRYCESLRQNGGERALREVYSGNNTHLE